MCYDVVLGTTLFLCSLLSLVNLDVRFSQSDLLRQDFADEQIVGFVPGPVDVFHRRFAGGVDVGEQVVRHRRRRRRRFFRR